MKKDAGGALFTDMSDLLPTHVPVPIYNGNVRESMRIQAEKWMREHPETTSVKGGQIVPIAGYFIMDYGVPGRGRFTVVPYSYNSSIEQLEHETGALCLCEYGLYTIIEHAWKDAELLEEVEKIHEEYEDPKDPRIGTRGHIYR